MLQTLRRFDRVFLGPEIFSCIGFDVYVDYVIMSMYPDALYVPAASDPVPYADVVQRFRALSPERRACAEKYYKDWAVFFDAMEDVHEALFAEEIVGEMFACLETHATGVS